MRDTWILTAQCPSRIGTVDVVTRYLREQGCYITELNSFDDRLSGRFFIRAEFRPQTEAGALDDGFDAASFEQGLGTRAADFEMDVSLSAPDERMKVVIMVSRSDHCLNDLLYRHRIGQLPMDITAVISNHPDMAPLAEWHGLPYHHLPITAETKAEQEARVWQIVQDTGAELVILARYMQVLSSDMCEKLSGRAINIHHSLLPGFKGARPYHQAYEKGVKLVGATAHYINDDLDEGPIITQGVETVDHAHYPEDLIAKGRDIECLTLSRGVRYHLERRVFLHDKRTVVFGN
ncbi:MAG: formyltetrahydrofolate deformylase [Cobetia sp.]|jgi:formyltetrahydrofolate deformylase|uniref:formyltetrahydrofolate deformylase n=1 Tax=Cobetia TaxID=204286 RepID=UPI000C40FDDE|nr:MULTISPECIES: formyltetrahydrofolate deformylase [Cobetia]AVV33763.1 formyltetrahydrofolate deformylase [Halomonas sp. SF2003]MBF08834.1 formyltetrahydrofolate deformylase [Cobetia sp.]MBK10199.1 formyltetrahydrofolate deformylase [Cobetia sp.]MCK8068798.1 formyltetrahydrofolate deformylase [Cobetia sp. 1CM21F]MDH2423077.1 formyltetrahydrofolate deformylase [Cobetia litoralis]|tara:strand:- start:173 stop:1048 length:876 start_codon:yes stop_codon:yes gene_type:complete